MSIGKQNGEDVLPEYAMDNLGTSFKVVLINSVQITHGENGRETFIPDYQVLIKKIAVTRAAHPLKLQNGDIKFLRKTLGLRSKALAEKLDISPEHLSRCEAGDKTLSLNSEKVLRSLVLLEAVYVLQKAVEDVGSAKTNINEKIKKLLGSLKDIVSGLKISPVHVAGEPLILHFRRVAAPQKQPANDYLPEWLDEAA